MILNKPQMGLNIKKPIIVRGATADYLRIRNQRFQNAIEKICFAIKTAVYTLLNAREV